MPLRTVEFKVVLTVEDEGEMDPATFRAALLDGLSRAEAEGLLTALSDETTVVTRYTVSHVPSPEPATPPTGTELGGWLISVPADPEQTGDYLYLKRDGAPGEIHVKAEDEGFVVDIWPDPGTPDDTLAPAASCAATYPELEPE